MRDFTNTHKLFSKNLTSIRLSAYQNSFDVQNKSQLMGTYLWGIQAASSLYPLLHLIEIFIRNSIDNAIRKKFGDFWWRNIDYDKKNETCKKFEQNIRSAENALKKNWRDKKKNSNYPVFTHNEIVAATDFSTWNYLFTQGFINNQNNANAKYIWPTCLGRAIPKYRSIHPKYKKVIKQIHDHIHAIRNYRNRVFHHEPIWTKGTTSNMSAVRSIQTIREKITKIDSFFKLLGDDLYTEFEQTSLVDNARKYCSIEYLHFFQGKTATYGATKKQKRIIRKIMPKDKKSINFIEYNKNYIQITHAF